MSNEDARSIVAQGLERRKQLFAEHEAALEQYEQDMIDTCNTHCADAKLLRQNEETGRLNREQREARRAARAEAQAKEQAREEATTTAVKRYILACMGIFWLTAFTHLPIWAAVTCALGLAVFPAVYIFRLYYPLEVSA